MNKGQLSIVIIVGLVGLIVIGLSYYIMGSEGGVGSGGAVRDIQLSNELISPVKEFVDGCLRFSSVQAIAMLGKQGGVLYQEQGGRTRDTFKTEGQSVLTYDDRPVYYAIHPPTGRVGNVYFSEPPEMYPWPKYPYTDDTLSTQSPKGFFGFEILPRLNGTEIAIAPTLVLHSMEQQLESMTTFLMDECLDFGQLSGPVSVTKQVNGVEVLINEEDVVFVLNATINVDTAEGAASSLLPSSTVRLPIRLKHVYETAKSVLGDDVIDITTDVEAYGSDGIIVTLTKDIEHPDGLLGDDLITILDNRGMLEGVPYEFRVMRHNRLPAMFFVKPDNVKVCKGSTVRFNGTTLLFEPSACDQGQGSEFPPGGWQALDPDGDTVKVTVTINGNELAAGESRTVSSSMAVVATVTDEGGGSDWDAYSLDVVEDSAQ